MLATSGVKDLLHEASEERVVFAMHFQKTKKKKKINMGIVSEGPKGKTFISSLFKEEGI